MIGGDNYQIPPIFLLFDLGFYFIIGSLFSGINYPNILNFNRLTGEPVKMERDFNVLFTEEIAFQNESKLFTG